MIVLAIESAALVASAALVEEKGLLAEISLNTRLTHSQTLLPMIHELFERGQVNFESVEGIAVSAGPGSFTGLRIGAATAKGLGMAWNKPLLAVPTLKAMAWGLWGSRFLVCPIMDARRSQVYTALYEYQENGEMKELEKAEAIAMTDCLEGLKLRNRKVVFTGDGLPVFWEQIREELGEMALRAPAHLSRQRAAAVGALGLEMLARGESTGAATFAPTYLRLSQAERERLAKMN
ncbi:MAG: tRNA (adenosine(37)-N6)-threonylcarbamoyltransferase complex dimerization subunit type 1 TsaB [Lachnospiraceae bacterium]|nr:tRNA (adenosine(37)-N6)-threonylcarbamoyltransferase complex dimerization subunit type 1 TsaB [Lachnospiraceae bacterium]